MSRYIDADALRDKLGRSFIDMDDCKFECPAEINGMLDYAIDCVNEQPTADVVDRNECSKCVFYPFRQLREQQETNVVDVVHGEWIDYKCSVCGFEPYDPGGMEKFNYCSNCGAEMRGVEDEN